MIAPLFLAAVAALPAFPGAEGYGAHATGGRGGDVYVVANLNREGPGSFADGLLTVPPAGRTIVFAVSGHIPIRKLQLNASNVTIAGQTAPGDGVALTGSSFLISGRNVVVRFLRFRHGKRGNGGDALNTDSGARATFTPTPGHAGRARFDFTVRDCEGSAWTQTCALVVTKP